MRRLGRRTRKWALQPVTGVFWAGRLAIGQAPFYGTAIATKRTNYMAVRESAAVVSGARL